MTPRHFKFNAADWQLAHAIDLDFWAQAPAGELNAAMDAAVLAIAKGGALDRIVSDLRATVAAIDPLYEAMAQPTRDMLLELVASAARVDRSVVWTHWCIAGARPSEAPV